MALPLRADVYDSFESCCCSSCGIVYYVPHNFRRARRDDHNTFYCPNGHSQYIPSESEAEKNARLLAEEKERHARTLARVNEAEAKATRLEKRIKAGVCPCCHRTFKQLVAHMKNKHPDYAK